MTRRGFAVIGTVWLLVVLIAAVAAVNASVRVGLTRSRNRLLLNRAEWAREACAEILLGRYRRAATLGPFNPLTIAGDTVDLGRGTWCAVQVEDPGARVNLNLADSVLLTRLLDDSTLVRVILAQRPLESVDQLETPELDSLVGSKLERFATVRGTGRVNLNSAPREVLQAITSLLPGRITEVLENRRAGNLIADMGEIGMERIQGGSGSLHEGLARVTLSPDQLVAEVQGGVRGSPIRVRAVLTLAPLPDRLAVLRRETE